MYLTINQQPFYTNLKPSLNMNYPKNMGVTKKQVIKEKNKMKYPKAWNYMKTKTGGHKLKFSKRQFKKFYVTSKVKSRSDLDFGFEDYF